MVWKREACPYQPDMTVSVRLQPIDASVKATAR